MNEQLRKKLIIIFSAILMFSVSLGLGLALGSSFVKSDIKRCAAQDMSRDQSGFILCVERLLD